MTMPVEYREVAQDVGPATAGFSMEASRATVQFFVDHEDLEDAITDLLGSAEPDGSGGISRVLPKAHPRFPWLFAARISNCVGVKAAEAEDAEPDLEAPALDQYGVWQEYLLTVEFEPRPYAVLDDASMTLDSEDFFPEDDDGVTPPPSVDYATEWQRFTEYDIQPGAELITAQQGQMVFDRDAGVGNAPYGYCFSGFPRMIVPGCPVVYKWYQVPFSYIDSDYSYIIGYQGYVNQHDWDGWPAGSLLYEGAVIKRYTPPMPDMTAGINGAAPSLFRLCDIEFKFKYTDREVTNPPTVLNRNWIAAGHNCPPWLGDRKFYYARNNTTDPDLQFPTFPSFPFSLLFTDPDA